MRFMFRRFRVITGITLLMFSLLGFASSNIKTVRDFHKIAKIKPFFASSYGYAVFPEVTSGGLIIGGSYGKGKLYSGYTPVADVTVSSLSVGLQLGAKVYSQIIFFKDKAAYEKFLTGSVFFIANSSATILTLNANAQAGSTGISSSAGLGSIVSNSAEQVSSSDYKDGMLTFIIIQGGVMGEASLGGQQFSVKRL
jgi:hypothetical protein